MCSSPAEPGASIGVRETALALLAARAEGATVCPSKVARAIAAAAGEPDRRGEMADVHAEVARMATDGVVRLTWRGEARAVGDGAYRIGRIGPS